MALLLAVAWHLRGRVHGFRPIKIRPHDSPEPGYPWLYESIAPLIEIPKRTYISVPQSIISAGGRPTFRDQEWLGAYQLAPLPVFDSARYLTSGMYHNSGYFYGVPHMMICLSFHWCKTLGIQQGGAILHDDPEADRWLRRARFDGRTEGVVPKDDRFDMVGWHCYMSPEVAALGLMRLRWLPKHNKPMPNDDYPDLSQMDIFK
jgi:hypothetical protein